MKVCVDPDQHRLDGIARFLQRAADQVRDDWEENALLEQLREVRRRGKGRVPPGMWRHDPEPGEEGDEGCQVAPDLPIGEPS